MIAKVTRTNRDDGCLYDNEITWAAKGLMMRLYRDQRFSRELNFSDGEWNFMRDILDELERHGYICVTENGNSDCEICIL